MNAPLPVKILLVEDNPTDALLTRESLAWRSEFSVRVAPRLSDAIGSLEGEGADVILLDLGLPDSQGIGTLQKLRSKSLCPIVVLTGNDNEEVGIQALNYGAQDYLIKRDVIGLELGRAVLFALERSRLTQALRESEERHRRLLEVMPDAVFVNTDDRISYCNPAFADLVGAANSAAVIGNPPLTYFHPKYHEVIRRRIGALHEVGDVAAAVEEEIVRLDGSLVPVEVGATAIMYEGSQSLLVMLHDLSPRREAEERMRGLEDQLRQSQKMEAVGRLAGGIAHDFNNILTVIAGYSEILLDMPEVAETIREPVTQIAEAGERAAGLTRQLLAFSRQTMMQPKVLDLNAIVKETGKLLHRLIGEDIQFTTVLAPKLARVKVDPGQLDQVLMNLAVNARDAMPTGGKLTLETSNVDLTDEYTATVLDCKPGPHVMLAMTDTGCSMSAETLERIFEPFFTTKSVGKGTGLGLSTVFGIVRQSGGCIHVYSEPGRGSTFKIYLPAVTEQLSPVTGTVGADRLKGKETILLVEDEEGVRNLALACLKMHGYQVLAAVDGQDALRVIQNRPQPIDLLLTDVVMPNLSGPELAEQVRQKYPAIKVVFMSGYTDDTVVRHGLLTAETAFIQKPYTPQGLAQKVRQVLDGLVAS